MRGSRIAGLAFMAVMAFAAVAQADLYPANGIHDKKGKTVTLVPKGTLYAEGPKGKPEPFVKKAVFVLNNTIIHKDKVKIDLPKMKEAPIKDITYKLPDLKWKPETRFIKNNTIIHKDKVKIHLPKVKEMPIKDITYKLPDLKWKPETQFIKNNTIIHKDKVKVHLPKVKEAPIVDITKPYKDIYDGMKKEVKQQMKYNLKEQHYHSGGHATRYGGRKAL